MIYINYDGLASPMLHTKFCGNRPTGSGEEDFLKVFAMYSHGSHLGHVTWTICDSSRQKGPSGKLRHNVRNDVLKSR